MLQQEILQKFTSEMDKLTNLDINWSIAYITARNRVRLAQIEAINAVIAIVSEWVIDLNILEEVYLKHSPEDMKSYFLNNFKDIYLS